MKKVFLLVMLCVVSVSAMFAQNEELPIDPNIRYGKLENGLTYYIRHNELPKDRVEIHIAQNVGSVLEEDDQNGLAHFLEHMCFNGTKNFPGNGVIKYCESIGVKFGVDLNAYTSFDKTVYRLSNVPTTRETIVDSCLLIIHDWAGALLLEDEEINKERGVIREEMRTYGGADWRMNEKILPAILPNNQYGKRNVIGTEEVIMNFKPQVLRDYYHKWYRPDLQAVIVIGDIDVDAIEGKIKNIFSDLTMPKNPAERIYFPVEDNKEPLVGIATDPEATTPQVSMGYKHDVTPKEMRGTMAYVLENYLDQAIYLIVRERIRDISQQANPPFVNAFIYNGNFAVAKTKGAWQGTAYIKDNDVESGFKAIAREMERINRYGFTASEYERARTNIITQYESYFNERSKTRSINYAEEYINHFTEGGYIPGIEMEYNLINMLAPNIPVELVNQYAMELVGDENIFITYEGPEKEGVNIPTREQLLTWLEEVRKEEIEPIAETLSNEPLLSEMPKGGTIVKEEHDKTYDATIYTLSNGVRVIIKSTNLKDDEILMTATSPGGSSLFPESDPINIQVYGDLCNIGGLGNFSASDLNKILAGKKASLSPSISILDEGFNGSSNVRDFETLLQLVYLNFTAPRMDQDAFESLIGRTRSQLEAMDAMPEMKFYKKAPEILYENPARFRQIEAADLDKVNYETIMNWRKERYADASDFTFIFVGNIDAKEHKDLLALYLGSLPSIDRKESFKPINVNYKSGMQAETIHQTMDNPKAIVMDLYWGNMEFNYKNVMIKDMLKQILTIVYQEKIREDEGGTYGVGVSSNLEYYPAGRAAIQVSFETENGKETYLNEIVKREFEAIAKNGPRAEDFAKVKEYVLKQRADGLQHNSYWRNSISQYYRLGLDNYSDFENIINSITPADIQKAAKTIIGAGNLTELYFVGDKK